MKDKMTIKNLRLNKTLMCIPLIVAILTMVIVSSCNMNIPSDTEDQNGTISQSFSFDSQADIDKFKVTVGATIAGNGSSVYEIDNVIFYSSPGSLHLKAIAENSTYYYLGYQLPVTKSVYSYKCWLKSENLHKVGEQYNNAYVGFLVTRNNGNKEFFTYHLPATSDWYEVTKEYTFDETLLEDTKEISFGIFLAITGDFWVDDLFITAK